MTTAVLAILVVMWVSFSLGYRAGRRDEQNHMRETAPRVL